MEMNRDKSAIMVLRKDRRTPGVERLNGDSSIAGIGVRTQYKYLGVMIEDTLECDKEATNNKLASKLSRKLATIFG